MAAGHGADAAGDRRALRAARPEEASGAVITGAVGGVRAGHPALALSDRGAGLAAVVGEETAVAAGTYKPLA